jgi:hypothetical protein
LPQLQVVGGILAKVDEEAKRKGIYCECQRTAHSLEEAKRGGNQPQENILFNNLNDAKQSKMRGMDNITV